ncbi:hypothetical protein BY996DRAFT_6436704 [Phakopsora pachyrhizi]|nr:hypothetical protein BY996DRAFT_6436704 [Phakopsora pachyrhizi]
MTILIDVKLEDPLIKDKKVSLLGGVICGHKISMGSVSEGSSYDLFDLVSRKTSISRRTSVAFNEMMRYIPQPLQRLIEKIDNPPKDGDCGYICVACSSGQGRGISTDNLIRKNLSAEFKKDKKMYEMIEGRNIDYQVSKKEDWSQQGIENNNQAEIDEDIRDTQAEKSAVVAGWLKMSLSGYAIANHLRKPLYYFSLDYMHTYLPTSSSYSGYPPFCMAFVNSNHYVVLYFKKVNGSIPAQPIDCWCLRKCSSRNKTCGFNHLKMI